MKCLLCNGMLLAYIIRLLTHLQKYIYTAVAQEMWRCTNRNIFINSTSTLAISILTRYPRRTILFTEHMHIFVRVYQSIPTSSE